MKNKKILGIILLLFVSILVTVFFVQKRTSTRGHAAGDAILEAENGSPSGNLSTKCDDQNASGGCYIQFGGSSLIPLSYGNKYGIHLVSTESFQLSWAKQLVGANGFIKFYIDNVDQSTTAAPQNIKTAVQWSYDNGLIPIVRLDGPWNQSNRCADNLTTTCPELAQAFKLVVSSLPKKNGYPLWIEIMNENNFDDNWGGRTGNGVANGAEYGAFLLQAAQSIRSLNDDRIKIMNGGLAPNYGIPQFGSGVKATDFIKQMFSNASVAQGLISGNNGKPMIDAWATHPYPGTNPPSVNYHNGSAIGDVATIDTYMQELPILSSVGMPTLPLILSETGYTSDANNYPFTQQTRSDYTIQSIQLWHSWPEQIITFVPFLLSDFAGGSTLFHEYFWVPYTSGTNTDGTPTSAYPVYTNVRNYRLTH